MISSLASPLTITRFFLGISSLKIFFKKFSSSTDILALTILAFAIIRRLIIKILTKKSRALVEGINKAKKHMRPTQDNPQGGIVEKELSIDLSNLVLMHKGKETKVGYKISDNRKKVRINKLNGNTID